MDFGVCVCGLGVVGGRLGVENRSLLGGGGWVGGWGEYVLDALLLD